MPCYGKSGILIYTLKLAWGRNLNKPSLMPPWWVYKNHGERSDLRLARFLCVSPCKRFDCVGAVLTSENHTLPLTAVLFAHFIRCLLSYSETG